MEKKLKIGFTALAVVLIAIAAFYLAAENTRHTVIGSLFWIGEGHEQAPAPASFTLEYVDGEDGLMEIYCDNPELMTVALIKEFRDGEHYSTQSYVDPRLGGGFCELAGEDSEIDVTLSYEKGKDLHFYEYIIYEKKDGTLYAKKGEDRSQVVLTDDLKFPITFDDRKRNLGCIEVDFDEFVPWDEIVVKFFDENDTEMDQISFIPEAVDGAVGKPANTAYAVCEYHRGKEVQRKIVENDMIEYIGFNKKLHIGVPCTAQLVEEDD